jgi:hypothetical protein
MLLGSVFVLAMAGFLIATGAERPKPMLAAIGLVVVGVALAALMLPYLLRRPALAMDARALSHALYHAVPWSEVVGIQRRSVQPSRGPRQHTLHLGVRDAQRYRRWWHPRWLTGANPDELVVPLNILDEPPEIVEQAALALRDRVSPPRYFAWLPGQSIAGVQAVQTAQAGVGELQRLLDRLDEASKRAESSVPAIRAKGEADVVAICAELDRFSKQQVASASAYLGSVTRGQP